MHRYLIILLAAVTLLSQWGLVEHAYHEHDENEVCEVCLVANSHDDAILPSVLPLQNAGIFAIGENSPQKTLSRRASRYYASRAPPHFL